MKRKTFLMIINILLEIVLYLHSTIITKSYYMKKLIYLSVLAFFAGSISSCKQENHPQVLNGIVYDATMNNITLITGKGDTINISTMDTNPDKVSGVLLEDSVEVTCIKEKIEGGEILKATELVIIKK